MWQKLFLPTKNGLTGTDFIFYHVETLSKTCSQPCMWL